MVRRGILPFLVMFMILISSLTTTVTAQEASSESEHSNYHTIASLGDSTLGSDPTGYRGPFASIHAANLMGLDYYEGAVGGDRSWTLSVSDFQSEQGVRVTLQVGPSTPCSTRAPTVSVTVMFELRQ